MLLSFSACVRPPNRIQQAAAEFGQARAGILLPPLPGECRAVIPHAPAQLGDNAIAVLARERAQLDRANGVIRRCAENYDTLKTELEGES